MRVLPTEDDLKYCTLSPSGRYVRDDNRLENLQMRTGQHGKGVAMECLDCGSHNVATVPLHTVAS